MKNLLVLLGPTGVGKTELSLQLAEHFNSPIINADSRQIYKDIEIGTAAPTAEELARVKHYFVHTLGLEEYYSAAEYEKDIKFYNDMRDDQLYEIATYGELKNYGLNAVEN